MGTTPRKKENKLARKNRGVAIKTAVLPPGVIYLYQFSPAFSLQREGEEKGKQ